MTPAVENWWLGVFSYFCFSELLSRLKIFLDVLMSACPLSSRDVKDELEGTHGNERELSTQRYHGEVTG